MNTTAFVLGMVLVLGYYFYTVRMQRRKARQAEDRQAQDRKGGEL